MEKTVFEFSEYSMIFYMKHVKLIKKLCEISTNFSNNVEQLIQSQTRISSIENCLFQTVKEIEEKDILDDFERKIVIEKYFPSISYVQ